MSSTNRGEKKEKGATNVHVPVQIATTESVEEIVWQGRHRVVLHPNQKHRPVGQKGGVCSSRVSLKHRPKGIMYSSFRRSWLAVHAISS
jgi:hypothetical protein